jgi:hypothetical protein
MEAPVAWGGRGGRGGTLLNKSSKLRGEPAAALGGVLEVAIR